MAEGVPTNNQRGQRSGPSRLWGGLDKARHIVPTALWYLLFFTTRMGIRRTHSRHKPSRLATGKKYGLVYWCATSHSMIFQLYMWRHRCADGPKKKLYLRSGSQRHRHFVGFFNMPVQAPTRGHPFLRLFWETAPFSRLLWHAGDTEDTFLTKPPGPYGSGGTREK